MPMTLTRSLLTILIPGLVATAPWLLALVQYTSATLGIEKNATLSNALIFSLAAVIGSLCEGLGTHIEVYWDSKREKEYDIEKNWYRYLNYAGEREPVAFRYLSRCVTSLYFELSMFFAVLFFLLGSALLASLRFEQYACAIWIAAVVVTPLTMWYFLYQASNTHAGMCKVRMKMMLPDTHVS
jgi:hypothetical protein